MDAAHSQAFGREDTVTMRARPESVWPEWNRSNASFARVSTVESRACESTRHIDCHSPDEAARHTPETRRHGAPHCQGRCGTGNRERLFICGTVPRGTVASRYYEPSRADDRALPEGLSEAMMGDSFVPDGYAAKTACRRRQRFASILVRLVPNVSDSAESGPPGPYILFRTWSPRPGVRLG